MHACMHHIIWLPSPFYQNIDWFTRYSGQNGVWLGDSVSKGAILCLEEGLRSNRFVIISRARFAAPTVTPVNASSRWP